MSKFDWMKRARNATAINEIKQILTEISQAYTVDNTLSKEAFDKVFDVCYDKIMELK